jgi:hypothetical protein
VIMATLSGSIGGSQVSGTGITFTVIYASLCAGEYYRDRHPRGVRGWEQPCNNKFD